jgi:Flp pilus assembly protein TadB
MVSILERYAAALLGFGVVATALTAGVTTALVAGLGAVAAWWLAGIGQRRRRDRFAARFMDERDRAAERRTRSRRAA